MRLCVRACIDCLPCGPRTLTYERPKRNRVLGRQQQQHISSKGRIRFGSASLGDLGRTAPLCRDGLVGARAAGGGVHEVRGRGGGTRGEYSGGGCSERCGGERGKRRAHKGQGGQIAFGSVLIQSQHTYTTPKPGACALRRPPHPSPGRALLVQNQWRSCPLRSKRC